MQELDEVLRTFDIYNPEHADDRWELFRHARRECPLPFSDSYDGQYHVTRYEDAMFVLGHPELFSSADPFPTNAAPVRLPPLDADPPEHEDYRRVIDPYLRFSALKKSEAQIRAIANEYIDAWIERGGCEFVADFAMPFTAGVLATVVFDETDPDRLQRAIDCATAVATKADPESFMNLAVLCTEYLQERRDASDERDDVVSAIARGTLCGREMTEEEQLGAVSMLFLGGLDTTRGAIGTIAHHLATVDGLEARLRAAEPPRFPLLLEIIRRYAPVAVSARTVLADVTLAGRELHAGDRLIVHFDAVNRDEARFDDPDELEFDTRRPTNLVFGSGIHHCVGINLARFQIELGFDELLRRVTRLRLADGAQVGYAAGAALGPESLPLHFDPLERQD